MGDVGLRKIFIKKPSPFFMKRQSHHFYNIKRIKSPSFSKNYSVQTNSDYKWKTFRILTVMASGSDAGFSSVIFSIFIEIFLSPKSLYNPTRKK